MRARRPEKRKRKRKRKKRRQEKSWREPSTALNDPQRPSTTLNDPSSVTILMSTGLGSKV
jgi:hypothetical protein